MEENDTPETQPGSQTQKFERLEQKLDQVLAKLPDPKPAHGLHGFANWIEAGWATRILAGAGIWLIIATMVGFGYEFKARQEDREARAEERTARTEEAKFRRLAQIATAWEILLTPVGGDIGKGNAINTLITAGQTIRDADFSCKAVGTWRDGECITPPQFNDVVLGEGEFWPQGIANLEISGKGNSFLENVSFDGSRLNNLVAEQLSVSSGFRNVRGKNWLVRNLKFPYFSYKSPDPFEGFKCEQCSFYSSQVHWGFLQRLTLPTISASTIFVPFARQDAIETEIARRANMGFRTYIDPNTPLPELALAFPISSPYNHLTTHLHNPALIVWSYDQEFDRKGLGMVVLRTDDPENKLLWSFYESMQYCVNREDWDMLGPSHEQEVRSYQTTVEHAGGLIRPPEKFIDQPFVNKGPLSTFEIIPTTGSGLNNSFSEQPTEETYSCGHSFEDVEAVLRPRLIEMVERQL